MRFTPDATTGEREAERPTAAVDGPGAAGGWRAIAGPGPSVALSVSEAIGSPIALAGREIVVPELARELAPRRQEPGVARGSAGGREHRGDALDSAREDRCS